MKEIESRSGQLLRLFPVPHDRSFGVLAQNKMAEPAALAVFSDRAQDLRAGPEGESPDMTCHTSDSDTVAG
jgi:hypothetical protein